MTVSHKRLKELLHYNPDTGLFVWLVRRSNVKIGSVAGSQRKTGYVEIGVDGRLYLAHRLAWFWVNGCWPSDQIDHINGIKTDNKLSNLREATTAENHQNMPARKKNSSGYLGVTRARRSNKWRAEIRRGSKRIVLGYFREKQDAIDAYLVAKAELHTFNPVPRGAAGCEVR